MFRGQARIKNGGPKRMTRMERIHEQLIFGGAPRETFPHNPKKSAWVGQYVPSCHCGTARASAQSASCN
jgi:hypothetical protein